MRGRRIRRRCTRSIARDRGAPRRQPTGRRGTAAGTCATRRRRGTRRFRRGAPSRRRSPGAISARQKWRSNSRYDIRFAPVPLHRCRGRAAACARRPAAASRNRSAQRAEVAATAPAAARRRGRRRTPARATLRARHQVDQAVDLRQALEVGAEVVEEDRRQRVARRSARTTGTRRRPSSRRALPPKNWPDGEHEDAPRAEMQRRRQRRDLPHRAVHVVVVADARRRKDERDRRRRHQVVDADACALAAPAHALPRRAAPPRPRRTSPHGPVR